MGILFGALGWNITGLRPDGTPEQQLFFARKQGDTGKKDAAYDRRLLSLAKIVMPGCT